MVVRSSVAEPSSRAHIDATWSRTNWAYCAVVISAKPVDSDMVVGRVSVRCRLSVDVDFDAKPVFGRVGATTPAKIA